MIPVTKWHRYLRQHLLPPSRDMRIFHVSAQAHSNAGDWILAESLRDTISKIFNKEIYWVKHHVHKDVTRSVIRKINRCDALVIGGGGLFLKDTNQNDISGWQWPCPIELMEQINVPIFVIAVGYNRFRHQDDFNSVFFKNVSELISMSKFFGLRNHGSIEALKSSVPKTLHNKISYFPCTTTVLSHVYNVTRQKNARPLIGLNIAYDRPDKRFGDDIGIIHDNLLRTIKKLNAVADIRYYVHCKADLTFLTFLQSAGIKCEVVKMNKLHLSMPEYVKLYSEPDLVIGMRGHAQMIPFGCGTPIISLVSHDKLQWFLDDIGHPEYGIEIHDPKLGAKLYKKATDILNNSNKFASELDVAKNKLFDITKAELLNILQQIQGYQQHV